MMITCEAYNRRLRDLMALGIFVAISTTASILLTPRDAAQTARQGSAPLRIERRAESVTTTPPGKPNKENKSAARASAAADGYCKTT